MSARRSRPLLFEVARRHAPVEPQPNERDTRRREPREPRPVSPPVVERTPEPDGDEDGRSEVITRRGLTMAIVATVVVVAVAVGIQTSRYFMDHSASIDNADPMLTISRPGTDASIGGVAKPSGSVQRSKPPTPPIAHADSQKPSDKGAAPAGDSAPRRVELTPGYSYVVAQYFRKRDEEAARNAGAFLGERGVACALLYGKDIRLVALQRFDTTSEDAAQRRRETKRADELIRRIKELGKEYFRVDGYDFQGCALKKIGKP